MPWWAWLIAGIAILWISGLTLFVAVMISIRNGRMEQVRRVLHNRNPNFF